jgi:VWFA-related protein
MRIIKQGFLFGLVLLLAFAPLQTVFAQAAGAILRITQVDNSGFPQVTVYVSVTDTANVPLVVDPNSIQIYENGQLMQPIQISGSGEIGPLTTLLVMDVSGSMFDAGKLTAAKAAAQAYIEQMRPGDQSGLLTFNTTVSYLQEFTNDHDALIQKINSLDARGDTAMFDALYMAAGLVQAVPGRKEVIVLTDGLDNRSAHTGDQVIQAIGTGGLSISTIGLGDPSKLGINSGLDEATLQSLATRAGGIYGYANDSGTLLRLYEQYGRALQSEYTITYKTSSILRDGLNRVLTVSLDGSDSTQASYNPGGLLPEISQGASWPIFIALLVALLGLLFVPGLVAHLRSRETTRNSRMGVDKPSPRIKLK